MHDIDGPEKQSGHYRWSCACGAFDVASTKKKAEKSATEHHKSHDRE